MGGMMSAARGLPAGLKYSATAAGGAAFGGVFPLFLLDKFGLARLLTNNTGPVSAVYAFTVFAMVSFLILGIGAFLARDGRLAFKQNMLFYVVVLTFVFAFVAGFVFFVGTAAKTPAPTVVTIAFDRFEEDVASFHDFKLSPYITVDSKTPIITKAATHQTFTDGKGATFGIDDLHDFEVDYTRLRKTLAQRFFNNGAMGDICRLDQFKSNATCQNWRDDKSGR